MQTEGIVEAVSEAVRAGYTHTVSDGFSEYAHASMRDDVRAGRGGRGVKRAVELKGVDHLVFSRLKPTG